MVKKESPRRRVRRVDTKLLSFDWGAFRPLSLVHGISEVPMDVRGTAMTDVTG